MAVDSGEFTDFTLQRAMDAELVDTFSTRNGKLVELMTDVSGEFIRRTYLPEAVSEVEHAGLSFGQAWRVYGEMYSKAGLELVDNTLIDETLASDPIIITKYLGELGRDSGPKQLTKEEKVELASGIGKLLTSYAGYMPDPQGLLPDAFAIDPDSSKAVLIDVDPYLKSYDTGRFGSVNIEATQGAFMRRSGRNIVEWAANEAELEAMATAFCITAGDALKDNSSMHLINDFSYVHFMSNGMSPEQLKQMGY